MSYDGVYIFQHIYIYSVYTSEVYLSDTAFYWMIYLGNNIKSRYSSFTYSDMREIMLYLVEIHAYGNKWLVYLYNVGISSTLLG